MYLSMTLLLILLVVLLYYNANYIHKLLYQKSFIYSSILHYIRLSNNVGFDIYSFISNLYIIVKSYIFYFFTYLYTKVKLITIYDCLSYVYILLQYIGIICAVLYIFMIVLIVLSLLLESILK